MQDDDRFPLDEPHVYAVEWTWCERVFRVDGRVHHRERRGAAPSHQHVVRSVLTCDYEVRDVVEVVGLVPDEHDDTAGTSSRTSAGR
jgi:hypothetical protein